MLPLSGRLHGRPATARRFELDRPAGVFARRHRLRLRAARRRGDRAPRRRAAGSRCPPPGPSRRLTAALRPAEGVPVELRGAGQASRQVNNFCTPATLRGRQADRRRGAHPGGNWSSYPPHKHDEDARRARRELEEIYYFEVAPATARLRLPAGLRHRRTRPIDVLRRGAHRRHRARSRTAGTARRWPRPATTSTTSTSWPARPGPGLADLRRPRARAGSAAPGTTRTIDPRLPLDHDETE